MTDVLIQPVPSGSDSFPRRLNTTVYRPPGVSRFVRNGDSLSYELKRHSKSDDSVLQSAPIITPEIQNDHCSLPIRKTASLVHNDDFESTRVTPKSKHFSDYETDKIWVPHFENQSQVCLAVTDLEHTSKRHLGLYDRVDPEDSIRDMITENDFYRFVLFKKHYEKYLDLSQKYEEARNIAYYLEEKYHEIKAERDGLSRARKELERKLESKELELHEKEEELFLQLEKVVRLEEDFEKLRIEKEKFRQWKDELEREKQEAFQQLKCQADESEITRRKLEYARQEMVQQMTVIASEKDSLEKENEKLKETLNEEQGAMGQYLTDINQLKMRFRQNIIGLEKEVTDLKITARQSASLNNHFKKGMKHLAMCKRKKCSVCAYTKATFGDYTERATDKKQLLSCFQAPLQDFRNWIKPLPGSASMTSDKYLNTSKEGNIHGAPKENCLSTMSDYSDILGHSSPIPSTHSEYSFCRAYSSEETRTSTDSPSPSLSLPLNYTEGLALGAGSGLALPSYISYIDEVSTSSESSSEDSGHGEESYSFNILHGASGGGHCSFQNTSDAPPIDPLMSSTPAAVKCMPGAGTSRAFSSDSGFSSELYETMGGHHSMSAAKTGLKLERTNNDSSKPTQALNRSKWTASFRKLINRMSKR